MVAHAMTHPKPEYLSPNQPTATLALAGLIREGQTQGIFRPDINAELAGALLIMYFFRLCVLDAADCRIVTAETESTDSAIPCGRDLIDEGLDLLYRGMLASPQ